MSWLVFLSFDPAEFGSTIPSFPLLTDILLEPSNEWACGELLFPSSPSLPTSNATLIRSPSSRRVVLRGRLATRVEVPCNSQISQDM